MLQRKRREGEAEQVQIRRRSKIVHGGRATASAREAHDTGGGEVNTLDWQTKLMHLTKLTVK